MSIHLYGLAPGCPRPNIAASTYPPEGVHAYRQTSADPGAASRAYAEVAAFGGNARLWLEPPVCSLGMGSLLQEALWG